MSEELGLKIDLLDLAEIMRPKSLEDFVGQSKIVEIIKKLLEKNKGFSAVFYGPVGTGKTTLARLIAQKSGIEFHSFNATNLKIEEIREVCKDEGGMFASARPLVFIDEIHRLNNNIQEVLLPMIEDRKIYLIAATSTNAHFSVINALKSRLMIFEFVPLSRAELKGLFSKAMKYIKSSIDEGAIEFLIASSNGDGRSMLKLLGFAASVYENIDREKLVLLKNRATANSSEDENYDLMSALIKSIRSSDVNASIYYLARLIVDLTPPAYIARKLAIIAAEDIGVANPNALNIANTAYKAVQYIGYDEARMILAQCVIYLAYSPKSDATTKAIDEAIEYAKTHRHKVPEFCRYPYYGYINPHENAEVKLKFLDFKADFVRLRGIGYEKNLLEFARSREGKSKD